MSDAPRNGAPSLTLERWRHLLVAPQTLICPKMTLNSGDHEPPIVEGSGEIRFVSPAEFEFTLNGTPADISYCLRQLNRQRDNPYDGLLRFRLVVKDAAGVEYAAGWTVPELNTDGELWVFAGESNGLVTQDEATAPSLMGSTEARYLIPRHHVASLILARFVSTQTEVGYEPVHVLKIEGTTVRFHFDSAADLLTITTNGSDLLPLTFAENWLGEPLRILLGQLIFPRLVARNFPRGEAMVSVRQTPSWRRDSNWAALWQGEQALIAKDDFWRLYGELLTFIAKGGEFEASKLTSLYEEVIQAARGSRWVWALTFASSVEGLVGMLIPKGAKRADANVTDIEALVNHIKAWPGSDERLRQSAINAAHRTAEATPRFVLNELRKLGLVTSAEVKAWEKVRNAVMHGSLVSPYSSEEDDSLLLALASLMRALTRAVVAGTPPALAIAVAGAGTATEAVAST